MAQFDGQWGLLSLDSQEKPAEGAQWVFGSDALVQFQSAHVTNPSYQVDRQRRFGSDDISQEVDGQWQQVVVVTGLKESFVQNNPALLNFQAQAVEKSKPLNVPLQPTAQVSTPLEATIKKEEKFAPQPKVIEKTDQNLMEKGIGVFAWAARHIANLTNAIGGAVGRGVDAVEDKTSRELPDRVQSVLGNGGYVGAGGALALGAVMPVEPVRHLLRDVGVVGLVAQGLYDIVGKKLLKQDAANVWDGVATWLENRAHLQPPDASSAIAR